MELHILQWCAVMVIHFQVSFGVNITALYDTLFTNYHPDVLPKCGTSAAVQVQVGLALRQIIDMNEPRQILETNMWVRLVWNDCQLVWNATETGIDNMVVPYSTIWVPDITLYDNAKNDLGGLTEFRPNIYPDGSVYYNFPSVIKSLCKVDVTYFPFDTQTCKLTFGSWSYHGLDLNVTKKSPTGDTSSYVANGEWHVVDIPAIRSEMYYGCCPEPYPDVTFYIKLDRKPLFYLLNLMFPCMLISTMGLLGFMLPPDSGEKVSLEITVLLSLAVFLLVVSETMPPTSETFPYIGIYFACAMLLISLSCLMTVTVLNVHFKGNLQGKTMPQWMRSFFLQRMAKIVFVKVKGNADRTEIVAKNKVEDLPENNINISTQNLKLIQENNINKAKHTAELKEIKTHSIKLLDFDCQNEAINVLHAQLQCLNSIKTHMDEKKDSDANITEWQTVAQIIDRMFLVLFAMIQVVTTLAIMIKVSTQEKEYGI